MKRRAMLNGSLPMIRLASAGAWPATVAASASVTAATAAIRGRPAAGEENKGILEFSAAIPAAGHGAVSRTPDRGAAIPPRHASQYQAAMPHIIVGTAGHIDHG